MTFYDEKTLETLERNMQMSPSTWHKVMNPLCGHCAVERGMAVLTAYQGDAGDESDA